MNRLNEYNAKMCWRNRSIPTQFRTSESTHSVMKMTMKWPKKRSMSVQKCQNRPQNRSIAVQLKSDMVHL